MTCLINKISYIFLPLIFVVLTLSVLVACQNTTKIFNFSEPTLESIQTTDFVVNDSEDVIGQIAAIFSKQGEVLPDIARHYALGYQQIARANQNLQVWQLDVDTKVILPLQFVLPKEKREGIVINLANMRMFYFPGSEKNNSINNVLTYPLGVGKQGWSTPLVKTKIISKIKSPSWHVPKSIRREHAAKGDPLPAVVLAGPDNPLGDFAMRLGLPSYLIHGTNKPYGVGLRVSHGCVRMYPENIEALFYQVKVGVSVNIIDQPYLFGWKGQKLYLEVHELSESQQKKRKVLVQELWNQLKKNEKATGKIIDWAKVERVLTEASGIPRPILVDTGSASTTLALLKRPDRLHKMPVVPPLLLGSWSIEVATFEVKEQATKLSAILNHQGPQIPSRVHQKEQSYQVIAGPFTDKNQTKKVLKHIDREFEIKGRMKKIE